MSRVLVTGADGQLGRELRKLQKLFGQDYVFTDVAELDITDADGLNRYLTSNPASYLINCAAYTDVDGAESEPEKAGILNRDAVENLKNCLEAFPALRLIHLSTDYVFPGDRPHPLKEDDPTGPESVYGQTKLEGESVLHGHPRAMVIRTSWLYSEFGKNFVKSMIGRMDRDDDMMVVYDQVGTPTYGEDLANAIMQIISDVESGQSSFIPGVFHYSNEGVCSWYDLAMEVCRLAKCKTRIFPIETADYPLPAKRPAYSVLSKSKIKQTYRVEVPHWRVSLEKCINHLL
ncbi:MAG TPA: dTDP-4-dehydrorhamnose reductase [Bacteroides sp.]|nr:dTDP-4-dehydrorhamnose reductase [Bacteroides sp.]